MDTVTHALNMVGFIASMIPFVIMFLFIGFILAVAIPFVYPVRTWFDDRAHWKTLVISLIGFVIGFVAFVHAYGVLWPVQTDYFTFPLDGATTGISWALLIFGWICAPISAGAGMYAGWFVYQDLKYIF